MLAKIRNNNKIYLSPVIAVSTKSYFKSKVVVFNEDYSKLIVVKAHDKINTNVLFLDADYKDFVVIEDNFHSIFENKNIFKIVEKEKYSTEMLDKAKSLLYQISKTENVLDDERILNTCFGSFEDIYVLATSKKDNIFEMLLNSTFGYYIILRCQDVKINDFIGAHSLIFEDCTLEKNGDNIVLNFTDLFSDENYIIKAHKITFDLLFETCFNFSKYDFKIANNSLIVTNDNKQLTYNLMSNIINFPKENTVGIYETFQDEEEFDFYFFGDGFIILLELGFEIKGPRYYKKCHEKAHVLRQNVLDNNLYLEPNFITVLEDENLD